MKLLRKIVTGGGLPYRHCEILQRRIVAIYFLITILPNLNAKELREICNNGSCNITTPQDTITNSTPFSTGEIKIQTQIQTFINRSTIKATKINVDSNSNYIANFYNYGRIETAGTGGSLESNSVNTTSYQNIHNYGYISGYIYLSQNESGATNITNYGEMGGVVQNVNASKAFTVDNRGTINLLQENGNGKKIHFRNIKSLTLQNYAMRISESASAFNNFDGNATDNSHLVLDNVQSVNFADKDSKMILDFGSGFEFGKGYLLSKLVVDTSGNNQLGVDFSRLVPRSDLFSLSQSGQYFIATLNTKASTIGNLYKANIRTMNNFYTISNSMIYPRKSYHSQNLTRKNPSLQADSQNLRGNPNISSLRDLPTANRGNPQKYLDSAISLKFYESFAYRNESINRRIQRQNKRNYNRKSQNQVQNLKENQRNSQNLKTDSANKTNQTNSSLRADSQNLRGNPQTKQNQRFSQNLAQTPHNYYFILTPFINHNLFFESGNYNLSGFDYGFLTAFSAQVAESNSLGAHFIFSYGSLGDSKDKDLSIKSLNLNVGINYKLDLIYDMYLKARGDFYYFSNALDSLTIKNIKPNNLGFGASVIFGKDFNFGKGGVLGLEAGLDYKALQSSKISLQNNATKTISETYQKALYNLIYVDFGVSYNKYFGNFGLNATLGIKGNITANKLAKSQIHISTFNKSVDLMLDNDNFLGYANLGASYVLNAKNFDMEFSLAYYGNFGDRVISNGGGVEWRVVW